MSQPLREYLNEKLAKNKIQMVIDYLLTPDCPIDADMREEVINFSGQFEDLQKRKRAQDLEYEDEQVQRNRIRTSLIEVVMKIPPDTMTGDTPEEKQTRWWIRGVAYLIFGAAVLAMAFQPKKNLRVEVELLVSRFSAKHVSGNYNLGSTDLKEAGISGFNEVMIEADNFAIDEMGIGEISDPTPLQGSINLTPYPESPGVELSFVGDLNLDNITVESDAYVTLLLPDPEGEPRQVRMIIEQKEEISGRFSYLHKLQLFPEQMNASGIPGWESFFSPVDLWLTGPTDTRLDLQFSSNNGLFSLDMMAENTVDLNGLNLVVKDPVFLAKGDDLDDPAPVSTVLGGIIRIKELQNPAMQVDTLKPRQLLNLISNEPFNLVNLSSSESGLILSLLGNADHIGIGPKDESYNPSVLKWLLHNYMLLLIGIGVLLIGLIFFLPKVIQQPLLAFLKTVR